MPNSPMFRPRRARAHLVLGLLWLGAATVSAIAAATEMAAADPGTPIPEPPPAGTAPPPAGDSASRVDDYLERGAHFFKDRHFIEAAEMLKKAYVLDPRPIFLFNMAQAYRRAGRVNEAQTLYHRFLDADPHTTLRAETESYTAELAMVIAERAREDKERAKPVYKKAWFWGVVAGSAAVVIGTSLGVGLGLGLRDDRAVVDLAFPLRR